MVNFIGICLHYPGYPEICVITPEYEIFPSDYRQLMLFLQNTPDVCIGMTNDDYDYESCNYKTSTFENECIDRHLISMGNALKVFHECMTAMVLKDKTLGGTACGVCKKSSNMAYSCAYNYAKQLKLFYENVDPARVPAKYALENIQPPFPVSKFLLKSHSHS